MKHLILSIALLMGIASSGQDVTMNFPNAVFEPGYGMVVSDPGYTVTLFPLAPRLREHIDLAVDYGLTRDKGKKRISEVFSKADAIAYFPSAYGYLKAQGWTDDRFMLLSYPSAAGLDAVWQGHEVEWTKPCMSRTNVTWPAGDWWFNFPAPICMGKYLGQGPHQGYNRGQAATTMHVWADAWLGDPHEQNAMMATSWGLPGNEGWIHGFVIEGFGFVGNRNGGWHDPNRTESGLAIWDSAEGSEVRNVWSSNFNGYGVKLVRGTPFTASSIMSVFGNTLGGVGILDGELGTFNLGTVSGDDNSALLVQDSKYGRGAGGMVTVALGKSESGHRDPKALGQIILWQKAPCVGAININMAQMAMLDRFVDAAFVMNSRAWGQTLTVTGFVGWNFRTLVHDVSNKKRWSGTSYRPEVFVWCSRDGGTLSDLVKLAHIPGTAVNASDRLGTVSNNGTFDYAAGTPAYSVTNGAGPTTPPPGPVDPPPGPVDPQPPPTAKPYTVTTSIPQHSSYEGIAAAVDGNLSTRWTSGKVPTSNDWITIDMGAEARWKTITLDATGSAGDFLSGLQVSVSANGTSWSKLTTSTAANATVNAVHGPVTKLTSSTWRTNRYIRIQPTVVGSKWWSIHEITVE